MAESPWQNIQFVVGQVRRGSRNLAIWNVLLLLGLVVVFGLSAWYYVNFFFGPFRTDDQQLLSAAEHPGNGGLIRYVELRDRQLIPTGMSVVTTVDGKPHSSTPYFFTHVGDHVMLVLANAAGDGQRLVGPLYAVPETAQKDVIDTIAQKHPELAGRFLPVMINGTAAFTVIGWIGLAVLLPLTLLAFVNLCRALLYVAVPQLHPAVRDAERVEQIDSEVDSGPVQCFGSVMITRSWVLQKAPFGLRSVPLHDVVWVYGQTARGIRVVVLRLSTGKTVYVKVPGKELAAAVESIAKRAPWSFVGFDKGLAARWQKRPADIIDEVQARRLPPSPP